MTGIPAVASLAAPQRVRRVLTYVGLAVLAVGLLWGAWRLWLSDHDADVVDTHEAGIAKRVTTATEAANATANANDAVRQSENTRADEQLRGAITDAQTDHPDETRRPAGPAVSGTLDRLRRRQAETGAPARKPS